MRDVGLGLIQGVGGPGPSVVAVGRFYGWLVLERTSKIAFGKMVWSLTLYECGISRSCSGEVLSMVSRCRLLMNGTLAIHRNLQRAIHCQSALPYLIPDHSPYIP